jgi:hypothetical protein
VLFKKIGTSTIFKSSTAPNMKGIYVQTLNKGEKIEDL